PPALPAFNTVATRWRVWRLFSDSLCGSMKRFGPGYIVRALGGAFFASGMLFMAYNVWRTVRASNPAEAEAAAQIAVVGAH
ncbi:hypothetical protein ACQKP4_25470, partial [Pseudomonas sp. NPDC086278]